MISIQLTWPPPPSPLHSTHTSCQGKCLVIASFLEDIKVCRNYSLEIAKIVLIKSIWGRGGVYFVTCVLLYPWTGGNKTPVGYTVWGEGGGAELLCWLLPTPPLSGLNTLALLTREFNAPKNSKILRLFYFWVNLLFFLYLYRNNFQCFVRF